MTAKVNWGLGDMPPDSFCDADLYTKAGLGWWPVVGHERYPLWPRVAEQATR